MASPSSARYGGAPAEAPPVTRAWLITPDAASVGPRKKCLTLFSANHISRLVLHVRKVDLASRRMRVVAQVPHGLESKLQTFIALFALAPECSAWVIQEVAPMDEERALFNGRQVLRTASELSGGAGSSGQDGDELSVVSSTASPTATIAAERERVRAEAERDAAKAELAAERAANAAALEAERAASAASAAALEAERAASAASAAALEAERAASAARISALEEQLRRLQSK
jgi:hypothetical protein